MMNTDEVKIVHFLPGRVRLKVATVRRRAAEAEAMVNALRSVPGIKSVEMNNATGSVLILYDPGTLASQETARHLRAVLAEHLPALDADQVLKWLGAPRFPA